jgi:hypothetical protein
MVSCKSQEPVKIVDPIISMSYEIVRDSIFSVLPDSLGGSNVNGLVVVRVTINATDLRILELEIKKIKLTNTELKKIIINYPSNLIDSNKLNSYYPFLYEYCRKIKIIEKHPPQYKTTKIDILTRFR